MDEKIIDAKVNAEIVYPSGFHALLDYKNKNVSLC